VWCICGHKELTTEWTSNKKLGEFIRKSQIQTKNDAYLEWIPFEFDINDYIFIRVPNVESTENLCANTMYLR